MPNDKGRSGQGHRSARHAGAQRVTKKGEKNLPISRVGDKL
jgi:hypothetical protein